MRERRSKSPVRERVKSVEPGHDEGTTSPRTRINTGDSGRTTDAHSTAPRLLTLRQAAEHLAVSYWTVRSWVERGKLASVRLPGDGRLLRVERSALDKLIEACRN